MNVRYDLGPDDRFIGAKEFWERLGISRSKFYTSRDEGLLPQPIHLTKRRIVWPKSVVDDVLSKIAQGELKL